VDGLHHQAGLGGFVQHHGQPVARDLVTAYPELLAGETSLPGLVFHKPVELTTLRSAVKACLGNSDGRSS